MVHMILSNKCVHYEGSYWRKAAYQCLSTNVFFIFFFLRMKPRKIKEDDAPRTIACPHKVSEVLSF